MKITIADRPGGGEWDIHAEGCADLRRYHPNQLWTVEVDGPELAYQAARLTYSDHVSDYGWTEEDNPAECQQYWRDAVPDFHVKPCALKH
jgi:hypothetical protein